MATKIVKNVGQKLEFGDEGNYGRMVPIAFDRVMTFGGNSVLSFCLVWDYADGTGRTIKLCHDNPEDIDFESFGTTYEQELKKVGLSSSQVQVISGSTGKKAYNIKDKDGTIRPFYDYEIDYDFVNDFIFIDEDDLADIEEKHPKHRIGPFQTEQRAREYFNTYIKRYLWQGIKNLTFTPVEPGQKPRTN
jgi:hypothetical protein